MRGLAKQSRHIMFTQAQLVEFGNYLLKTYGVQVHSTDGKNQPIYQREVSDADFSNWSDTVTDKSIILPSAHQMGDEVWVHLWVSKFCGYINGIHFYEGKVKYDIKVYGQGELYTKLYNIDSAFVSKDK